MSSSCYIVTYDVSDNLLREELGDLIASAKNNKLSNTTYLICCDEVYITKFSAIFDRLGENDNFCILQILFPTHFHIVCKGSADIQIINELEECCRPRFMNFLSKH